MSIWDYWQSESKEYIHGKLSPKQVSPELGGQPIQANQHYVQVMLRRMRIVHSRVGWKKYHAAVYGDVGLWHDRGKMVNFKQFVAPPDLQEVDAKNTDHVIISNQLLFGPTPYRGGALQLNVALVSIESANFAGPFLGVLAELASAGGVTFVSAAQPFLKPLTKGIELLSGTAAKSAREIQVVTNITEEELATGAYVVVRSTGPKLTSLRVDAEYKLLTIDNKEITGCPYFVLTIEADTKRHDWKGIPDIKSAYDRVAKAVEADQPTEYEESFRAFRRTAMLNDDLIPAHAEKLAKDVKTRMDAIMGPSLTFGGQKRQAPKLDEFDPFA